MSAPTDYETAVFVGDCREAAGPSRIISTAQIEVIFWAMSPELVAEMTAKGVPMALLSRNFKQFILPGLSATLLDHGLLVAP